MIPPYYTSLPKRFWDKVEVNKDTGCWEWTAVRHLDGYGKFKLNGKTEYTHRLALADAPGGIPAGKYALHKCGNPPCVNRFHLYVGTHVDNMRDMAASGVHRGERHSRAKLSNEIVLEARRLYFSGKASQSALARKYDVAGPVMHRAILGRTWSHI